MSVNATTTVSMSPASISAAQLVDGAAVVRSCRPCPRSYPMRPRSSAEVASQCSSITARAAVRRRRRGWPRRPARAGRWSARCCAGSTGMAMSMLVQRGLRAGHGVDEHRRARQRRDREVQPRVGDPVRRGVGGLLDLAQALREPGPLVAGQRLRSPRATPRPARRPGGRSARRATSAPLRTKVPGTPVATPGSAAYVTVGARRRAPAASCTRPESRSAAIASRRVLRLTPSRSASSRSGGSCSPSASTPRRIARASCSTVFSKALPAAGRSTASGNAVERDGRRPLPRAACHHVSRRSPMAGLVSCPFGTSTHEVDRGHRRTR